MALSKAHAYRALGPSKKMHLFKNGLFIGSTNLRFFSDWLTQSQNAWFSKEHKHGSTRPSPPQGVHFSNCTIETNLPHVQVEDVAICISKHENAQIFGGRREVKT